jgi:hypothetical protein
MFVVQNMICINLYIPYTFHVVDYMPRLIEVRRYEKLYVHAICRRCQR